MAGPITRNTFLGIDPGPSIWPTLRWTQAEVDRLLQAQLATGINSVTLQWAADGAYGDCY